MNIGPEKQSFWEEVLQRPVTATILDKISSVTNQLHWKLNLVWSTENYFKACSNPWAQEHVIFIPPKGDYWSWIQYLHELAHSFLAEKHHLFGSNYFATGTPKEIIDVVINPVKSAGEWLADGLLMEWIPEEMAESIKNTTKNMICCGPQDNLLFYVQGLLFGEAVRYLKVDKDKIPGLFHPIIDVLVGTDPNANLEILRELANRLTKLRSQFRVEIIRENGYDLWQVLAE